MSQKFKSELELQALNNATTDTDKFLVSDSGIVKYRTGAEMLSDLGVAPGVASNIQHQVKAGVAINKGQAVYVTSADGTNMVVGLASNASEATSSKTMGLLASTVSINGFANVIAEGLLAGLNTIGATAGDPVWLGTGGNLIYGLINKPYAPAHLVFIGIVTRVNSNNGEIFVKVQNGFELKEIHDVDLITTTPLNGHLLGFNGTLWVNKTIAGWLGYTPADASHTHTFDSLTAKTSGTGTYQTTGEFIQNNGKYVRDSYYRTISGRSDLYSGGSEGWYTVAQVTLAGNCSGSVLYGTLYDHRYNGADSYQIAVVARAECDFESNNQSHYVNVGCTILGSTNYTNYRSKIRVVLTTSTTNNRTYQLQFFETAWNNDAWQLETNGWTIYNSPQTASAEVGTPLVNYVSNQNADYQKANTATYSPVYYDTDDTAYYLNANSTSNLASTYIAGHYYGSYNANNILLKCSSSSASYMGVLGQSSSGAFGFQLFGDGSNYGFLNGNWADWDIRKSINGNLYLNNQNSYYYATDTAYLLRVYGTVDMRSPIYYDNDNTGYYVNPASTSNLYTVNATNYLVTPLIYSGGGSVSFGNDLQLSGNYLRFDESGVRSWNQRATGGNLVLNSGDGNGNLVVNGNAIIHSGNIGSQSVSYATTAGTANGVSWGNVTSKPSNIFYYQGFTLDANTMDANASGFTYAVNAPFTGPIARFATNGNYDMWINSPYSEGGYGFAFRTRNGDTATLNPWRYPAVYDVNANGGGVLYATVYYDQNNTAYYIDANNTSNLNVLQANRYVSYSANNTGGLALNNGSTYWGLVYNNSANDWRLGYGASNSAIGWNLRWDDGGTTWANSSMRAPIFYDSDNTAYYTDPYGSSVLNTVIGNNFYNYGWFRNYNNNTGLYNEANANHIYSRGGTRWGITGNGSASNIYLDFYGNHESTYRGSVHADTSSNIGFLTNDQGWGIRVETNKNVHVHGTTLYISADGQNSSNIIMKDGDEGDRQIHCNSNRIGFLTAGGSWGSYCSDNGDWSTDFISYAGASSRAPIFYDSDNTAYYLDAASTSSLNGLQLASYSSANNGFQAFKNIGTITPSWPETNHTLGLENTDAGYLVLNFHRAGYTSNNLVYDGSLFSFDLSTRSSADFRAPVFYDSDNTGYYINPASSTTSINVAGNIDLIARSAGWSEGIRVRVPSTSTWGGIRFTRDRFNDDGNWAIGFTGIDATDDLTFWKNNAGSEAMAMRLTKDSVLTVNGDVRSPIFYDSNNTGFYVNPAGSSNVNRVFYNDYLVSQNSGGIMGDYNINGTSDKVIWTIGESWPLANMYGLGYSYGNGYGHHLVIKNNGSVYHRISFAGEGAYFTGTVTASGSSRAPIFYDTDNTSYYVDPASGANLYDLTISGASQKYLYINPGNGYEAMVRYNGGSGSGWYVGKRTANQTVNTTDFHFFSEAAGMTVAGIDTGGNIFSTQSVRTGVFYDLDDTSYFVNPASSSKFNNANFTGNCSWFGGYGPGYGPGLAFENQGSFARIVFFGLDFYEWDYGLVGGINNGYIYSNTSFRAPIFYDSNNTAYYFDGSNTGDSIRCAGDIVAYYSDERLKDKKGNIENALEKVLSLNGFYYEPNEVAQSLGYKKRLEVGVSAQEVEAVLPEIIKDAPIGGDYKTLDYGKLTPLLIEAVKEQQKQIEELKELVNKLINK